MDLQAISAVGSSATISPAAAAIQEATENAATTKAEAAKGDQQAVRKLAAEEQKQPQNSLPGVGEKVDLNG